MTKRKRDRKLQRRYELLGVAEYKAVRIEEAYYALVRKRGTKLWIMDAQGRVQVIAVDNPLAAKDFG